MTMCDIKSISGLRLERELAPCTTRNRYREPRSPAKTLFVAVVRPLLFAFASLYRTFRYIIHKLAMAVELIFVIRARCVSRIWISNASIARAAHFFLFKILVPGLMHRKHCAFRLFDQSRRRCLVHSAALAQDPLCILQPNNKRCSLSVVAFLSLCLSLTTSSSVSPSPSFSLYLSL